MILAYLFIYNVFYFSHGEIVFLGCNHSSNFSQCQEVVFNEELKPETVINTFKFADLSEGNLSFELQMTDQNLDSKTYLFLSIRDSEFDLVIGSRIDREEFMTKSISLDFDIFVNGSQLEKYSFSVTIEDIDDNVPFFEKSSVVCPIYENDPSGSCQNLTVIDLDNINNILNLQIKVISMGSESDFLIIKTSSEPYSSGYCHTFQIALNRSLDYEEQSMVQLEVQAQDSSEHTVINEIYIQVMDVSDCPPIFLNLPYYIEMKEEEAEGSKILTVSAIDGDRTVKSPIKYSFKKDNIENSFYQYFDLNDTNGEISISKKIYLRISTILNIQGFFDLTIIATEIIPSFFNSKDTTVRVFVTDINNSPTLFSHAVYQGSIQENSRSGSIVNTKVEIEIKDEDLGKNAEFSVNVNQEGNISHMFEIHPAMGMNKAIFVLRLKHAVLLDHETVKFINLTIEARQLADVVNIPSITIAVVSIEVVDANDNSPIFVNSSYTFQILENPSYQSPVGKVTATDEDSGTFGMVSYSIKDPFNKFDVNNETGWIYVNVHADQDQSLLDREEKESFYIIVVAKDFGGRVALADVRIILKDVNDNPPRFEKLIYQAFLTENSYDFSPKTLRVKAADIDKESENRNIQYKIWNVTKGSDASLKHFRLNHSTGEIIIVEPISKEHRFSDVIQLNIRAFDITNQNLFDSCLVNIDIRAKQEAPIFSQNNYSANVSSNISSDETIIFVSAIHYDKISSSHSSIMYRMNGIDSTSFVLESVQKPTHGAHIRKRCNIDLKSKIYNFIVEATYMGNQSLWKAVSVVIRVSKINDKSPSFNQSLYRYSIPENLQVGSVIGQVFAADPDNESVLAYSIIPGSVKSWDNLDAIIEPTGDFSTLIEIHNLTGDLLIKCQVDRERISKISAGIQVIDLASETEYPMQIPYTNVEINIQDLNDNPPEFKLSVFHMRMYEDATDVGNYASRPTGYFVTASDIDTVGKLQYNITDPTNTFHVDPISGYIFLLKPLDREKIKQYNLTIDCTDGEFTTNASLLVLVLDINDNEPYFIDNITVLHVLEDAPMNTVLATFVAHDIDEGENAKLTFSLKDEKENKFKLYVNGTLTLANSLTIDHIFIYHLTIEIYDNPKGKIHFRSTKEVTINVTDINNHRPEFEKPKYHLDSITEYEIIGHRIGEISANDKDIGENANIKYELVLPERISDSNAMNLFRIQKTSGKAEILVNSSLRNGAGKYTLILIAEDNGVPSLNSTCTVVITVKDINDHYPIFINPSKKSGTSIPIFSVVENQIDLITIIQAYDNDTGLNGKINFALDSQNLDHEFFNISDKGKLWNVVKFDREIKDTYRFQIFAHDFGLPSLTSYINIEINILDLDDNLPIFLETKQKMTFSIFEGFQEFSVIKDFSQKGFKIGNVAMAMDKDVGENAIIVYLLLENLKVLYLDPFTGDLYGLEEFDREERGSFEFTVKAIPRSIYKKGQDFDGINRKINYSEAKVTLIIKDINDNPPVVTTPFIIGMITSTTLPGTVVINLSEYVTDKDIINQNNLTFSIMKMNSVPTNLIKQIQIQENLKTFILDPNTGILYLALEIFIQDTMNGHIEIIFSISDGNYKISSSCIIYLVGQDQKIRFIVEDKIKNVLKVKNDIINDLSHYLKDNTSSGDFKIFADLSGNSQKELIYLYVYALNTTTKKVFNGKDLLLKITQSGPKLLDFYKKYKIINVKQPITKSFIAASSSTYFLILVLLVTLLFVTLIIIIIHIWICKDRYRNELKAYTNSSLGSSNITNLVKASYPNIYKNSTNKLPKVSLDINTMHFGARRGNKTCNIGIPVYGLASVFPSGKFDFTDDNCEIFETKF